MKYFMIAFLLFATAALAETKEDKSPCGDPASMEQVLLEKGYFHLLDMKNENGVTNQLWTGGRSMVITAEKDKKVCFVSTADEVTYNPVTLQKIIEVWKKTQKDL